MKKLTLCAGVLLVLSLSACSGNKDNAKTTPEPTKSSSVKEETKESTEESTEESEEMEETSMRGQRRDEHETEVPDNDLKSDAMFLDAEEPEIYSGHFSANDEVEDYMVGTWENDEIDVFLEFNPDGTYDIYEIQDSEVAWIEYGDYLIDEYGFILFDGYLSGKYSEVLDEFKLQGFFGNFFKTSDGSYYEEMGPFDTEYISSRGEYQDYYDFTSVLDEVYPVAGYWYNYLEEISIVIWEDGVAWELDEDMEVLSPMYYSIENDGEVISLWLEEQYYDSGEIYAELNTVDGYELYISGIEGSFTFIQDLSD